MSRVSTLWAASFCLLAAAPALALEWPASITLLGASASSPNVTVYAQPATGTPRPTTGQALRLLAGGDGCTHVSASVTTPFALLVERGLCSFDDKMRTARATGASILIVADSTRVRRERFEPPALRPQVRRPPPALLACRTSEGWAFDSLAPQGAYSNASGGSPASMALNDPCMVDCSQGRGVVDATSLSRAQVLGGLVGQCGSACAQRACAFSGGGSSAAAVRHDRFDPPAFRPGIGQSRFDSDATTERN